jgi:ppGpp synthetase/RelA/SpoT-type nucleotidyltranferase
MSFVNEFFGHYIREFDFYEELARIVRLRLEDVLATRGIRAIVTSRGKSIQRLQSKVTKRNAEDPYPSVKAIYDDIIDLAGVRVALYFPTDREKVAKLIEELFVRLRDPKVFPESKNREKGKVFTGYAATHYLVSLKPFDLDDSGKRYEAHQIEIQVASVLTHAWAEVEHDLEYKPERGGVSEDESSILDQLNGLVLSGELALESLQRAIQRRTTTDNVKFSKQFELAAFLSTRAEKESFNVTEVGRVDVLLEALRYLEEDNPEKLNRYLSGISHDDREQPIADYVIDRILSRPGKTANEVKHLVSEALFRNDVTSSSNSDRAQADIGLFLNEWKILERTLRRIGLISEQSSNLACY